MQAFGIFFHRGGYFAVPAVEKGRVGLGRRLFNKIFILYC